MEFLLLYIEFFKIGVFAVGGGLATLPFLFLMANDRFAFIRRTGWLNTEQVGNFLAVAQCSPGAVGVNVAAQTGFQYGGIPGGIAAALGLISPAIIIISAIAGVLQSIKQNKAAVAVFSGLRPAAAGLLTAAGLGVWRLALYNNAYAAAAAGRAWHEIIRWREGLVCLAIFLLIVKFKGHPVVYIALGAIAWIALGF
ncbi:MAG: chromate transporter [Treponema sp.]|jgi:chromate transporter|nr:chromate transporter [Treponema sp.]